MAAFVNSFELTLVKELLVLKLHFKDGKDDCEIPENVVMLQKDFEDVMMLYASLKQDWIVEKNKNG